MKHNIQLKFVILITVTIIFGYFRYLDPGILRVFGDISPKDSPLTKIHDFQYYGMNFQESFLPNYYAPFRYQLDYTLHLIKSYLNASKELTGWIGLFLPFLISSALSGLFFLKITPKPLVGYIGWLTYIFSTFVIFTSSIHTPIITGLNLILFFFYQFIKWLESTNDTYSNILFVLSSSVTIILASIFELRMLIVSMPFILLIWFVLLKEYNIKLTHKTYKTFKTLFITHLGILAMICLNFVYLVLNISSTIATTNLATNRTTWGNNYFQLINTLSLSHPFWNNSSAENFVYNPPSIFHWPNIIISIFIICFGLLSYKRLKYWSLLILGLILCGFLSKQNNEPFRNIYDYLYQLPYFNLSREASKYYYSFGILWSILFIKIVDCFDLGSTLKYKSIIRSVLIVLVLIPVITNIFVIVSGNYKNSSTDYSFNSQVYDKINSSITQSTNQLEKRVLWLPLMGTLQSNTENINHMSYSVLVNMYPLANIQKINRSYLFESLGDNNFKKYIKLMGFNYVIIPNLENEPSIKSQMFLGYNDFDISKFTDYVTSELPLEFKENIDGYKLYKLKWDVEFENFAETLDLNDKIQTPESLLKKVKLYNELELQVPPKITKSILPEEYGEIGNIELSDNKNKNSIIENKLYLSPEILEPGNCNSNAMRGLDFKPEDRILVKQIDYNFNIDFKAKNEEIPCIKFQLEAPSGYSASDLFIEVSDFIGANAEVVVFTKDYPDEIKIEKFLNLKESGSNQLIPLACPINKCVFNIYFKGQSLISTKKANFNLKLLALQSQKIAERSKEVIIFNENILNLKSTNITFENTNISQYSYLLFRYQYDPNYIIQLTDGKERRPLKNNHNLLLFEISSEESKNARLVYLPEAKIKNTLTLTNNILYITLFLYLIFLIAKPKYRDTPKSIYNQIYNN